MSNSEHPDLSAAVDFITRQITQEAHRSDQPLDEEEQFLLANLPRSSAFSMGADAEDPLANPRDLAFEKLCTLAKSARIHDLSLRSDAANDWEFAIAVLTLQGHPMLWLLQWAGIKEKKPWWDRWLLFIAAILLSCSGSLAIILAISIAENGTLRGHAWWAAILFACVLLLLLLLLISRRLEHWHLQEVIGRRKSSFAA